MRRPPRPYGARIGHQLLRRVPSAWQSMSLAGLAVFGYGVSHRYGLVAGLLVLGLPMIRTSVWFPWLTDQTALGLLGLLLIWPEAWWLGLIGGLFSERMPVFGALATLNPLVLLGLVPWGLSYLLAPRPTERDHPGVRWPFRAARANRARLGDPGLVIMPWGVLLLGVAGLDAWGWLTLAVAYAQLLVAQDVARLYQWGCLALVAGLAAVDLPPWCWPVLVVLHWASPWRGTL